MRYQSLSFTDLNIVLHYGSIPDAAYYYYCAGCNGNFKLHFDGTSRSVRGTGVPSVAVDVVGHTSRHTSFGDPDPNEVSLPGTVVVEFGNGETMEIGVPADVGYFGPQAFFIGLSDKRLIRLPPPRRPRRRPRLRGRLHLGHAGGHRRARAPGPRRAIRADVVRRRARLMPDGGVVTSALVRSRGGRQRAEHPSQQAAFQMALHDSDAMGLKACHDGLLQQLRWTWILGTKSRRFAQLGRIPFASLGNVR